MNKRIAVFHLPSLFEQYTFYRVLFPFYRAHPQYFYDWVTIGSLYGAPSDCLWAGGRVSSTNQNFSEVDSFLRKNNIAARLTLSNCFIKEEDLNDKRCNELVNQFHHQGNGIIIYSDLLLNYLKNKYPNYYYVSSTTKVITDFDLLVEELNNDNYQAVVPDFRLNHHIRFNELNESQKDKIELLCNECCYMGCKDRKLCYESVSNKNRGIDDGFVCKAPDLKDGYHFYKARRNPSFISIEDIQEKYLPMGIHHFKIEGRGLGSGLLLEFILYYLVKPEYQLEVREKLYLENTLDLF